METITSFTSQKSASQNTDENDNKGLTQGSSAEAFNEGHPDLGGQIDTHSSKHTDTHSSKHTDTHSAKHNDTHSTKHIDTHSTKHTDTHSAKHTDTHSTKHTDTHSTKHSDTHSTKQRDTADAKHTDEPDKHTDIQSTEHTDTHSPKHSDTIGGICSITVKEETVESCGPGLVSMTTDVETDVDDITALLEGQSSASDGGPGPLRSRRKFWKKRVADYVCSLPSFDKYDELGILSPEDALTINDDGTDWKRQKLDEDKKSNIESTPPVEKYYPRGTNGQKHQLMKEKSFDCQDIGPITTSVSDSNAIHQWLHSVDEPHHQILSPTTINGPEKPKTKLMRIGSLEDDLSLGAEATLMQPMVLGVPISPTPDTDLRNYEYSNEEILAYAGRKSQPAEDRKCWLTRMAERHTSMTSELSEMTTTTTISSVDDLLQARNDPEQILRSLGFGSVSEDDSTCRIPDRFLSKPSQAKGIDLQKFLECEHEKDENRAASVGGYLGIEGAGVFRRTGATVVSKVATMNSIVNMMKKSVARSSNSKSHSITKSDFKNGVSLSKESNSSNSGVQQDKKT